jgi:hypothetical protein
MGNELRLFRRKDIVSFSLEQEEELTKGLFLTSISQAPISPLLYHNSTFTSVLAGSALSICRKNSAKDLKRISHF